MKYWTFDVVSLISEYPKNKRTLEAINEALKTARVLRDSPVHTAERGDWKQYISILEIRQVEYEMYVDMVVKGFGDLPETERLVLHWWLIDHYDDKVIVENGHIKNLQELQKIKKIAITKFTNIVMPN